MANKKIHIIGGGTISHMRSHLALTVPAYGTTARRLRELCNIHSDKLDVELHLTKMANSGRGTLETNADVDVLVEGLISSPSTKIIFFNVAMTDYNGAVLEENGISKTKSGKYEERLETRKNPSVKIELNATEKVISKIRRNRKDIFLVGFKTTNGMTKDEQYIAGLNLLKGSSCNLVLANDVKTRNNMIITPEEARYHVTTDRDEALKNLVEMTYLRSHLTFTRSTIVDGRPINWNSDLVPESLRKIVDYCIENKAYKAFRGSTVGHFAVKLDDTTFLTSRRKTNFNNLNEIGLVKVKTDGPDTVIAYGSKPSVGGQSQRLIFSDHADKGYDCIVHFHCPLKVNHRDEIPVMSQREYECGSHECGKNTSNGLKDFGGFSAVMLDNHGPNIVFNKGIDPEKIIDFIESNFDLEGKTGGYVELGRILNSR